MERADFSSTESYNDFIYWRSRNTEFTHNSDDLPTQPETNNGNQKKSSGQFSGLSVDDLLLTAGRENMKELNPKRCGTSTWFSCDMQITKNVLRMMKSNLPFFCPTYSVLPEEHKKQWFKAFAQEFNWNPTYTCCVRKEYDAVAASVFSNHIYKWKKNWKAGKGKPVCITDSDVWNEYINYWNSEKAKKIASKNKANRKSLREGDGPAAHTTGAKSYIRRYDEMTLEAGHPPSMVEFMVDTHTNKKTKKFVDKRAERIVLNVLEKEKFLLAEETQDGSEEPNSLSQAEINSLFLKEVELVKGRHFGFGSLQAFGCSSSSFSPEIMQQLRTANIKMAEMERTQVEQEKAHVKQAKELEQFKKLFLQQFPNVVLPSLDDN